VAISAAVNPVSTASADDIGTPVEKSSTLAVSPTDAAEDPGAAPNDSSDGLALSLKMEEGSGGGDEAGVPYAAVSRTEFKTGMLQRKLRSALLPFFFFVQSSWDGDAESLLTLMPFMPVNNFCHLYFGYVLNVVLDSK
jgi:hypothetical protein